LQIQLSSFTYSEFNIIVFSFFSNEDFMWIYLFVWVCVLHPVYAFVPPFPYLHSPTRKLFLCTCKYVNIITGTTLIKNPIPCETLNKNTEEMWFLSAIRVL
jgi:hypothetical protein